MVFDILGAILLFSFAIPVVMYFRIWPVDGTPYGLFGFLFVLLLIHVLVTLAPEIFRLSKKTIEVTKTIIMWLVFGIVIGGVVYTAMIDRSRVAPVWGVHDIILQEEAAIRYLVNGRNPYKETYFGTPVESFTYEESGMPNAVNPALYHFVMPPWYLLFPLPFYYVSVHTLGFFDARMPLLFLMGMMLCAIWFWFRDKSLGRLAMIITALAPSVVHYFVEGRSDVFALSWFVASLLFFEKQKYAFSAVLLGLAVMSKQTIWFSLPFVLLLFFRSGKFDWPRAILYFSIVAIVVLALVMPFIAWDARAFIESVVLYLTGNATHSYPVAGYGWGMVLLEYGIIRDTHAYYPFIFWQLAFAGPIFAIVARWVLLKPQQWRVLAGYATFLMVFWYFSRYFNNSHLGYIAMVFVLAALKKMDEEKISV